MNEQPTKEWWLQSDLVKEGWGPFESEAAAWRHLFGRDPCAEDIRQHEEAGWYVGFINKWPNAQAMANTATLNWSLWVECPKCGEGNDLSDDDDEHLLATKIFNNKWDEAKGHECTCRECGHEYILDGGIEY